MVAVFNVFVSTITTMLKLHVIALCKIRTNEVVAHLSGDIKIIAAQIH